MSLSIEDLVLSKITGHIQLYDDEPSQIILSKEAYDKLTEEILTRYHVLIIGSGSTTYMGIPVAVWDVEGIQVGVKD